MPILSECIANAPYPVIGITGGIAAGKTSTSALLKTLGWTIINIDQIAREVVEPGKSGLHDIVNFFGTSILDRDKTLDRVKLADIVFKNSILRNKLELILYHYIESNIITHMNQLSPTSTKGVALDAALWIEFGLAHIFDAILVIEADEIVRINRLAKRDNIDIKNATDRIRSQSTLAEKKLHTDLIFYNNDGQDLTESIQRVEQEIMLNWHNIRSNKINYYKEKAPFTLIQLQTILEILLKNGGEYAEVFIEKRNLCGLCMDNYKMEDILLQEIYGVRLQLVYNDTARSADLISPTFDELIINAHNLSTKKEEKEENENNINNKIILSQLVNKIIPTTSPIEIEPKSVSIPKKADLLRRANNIVKSYVEKNEPGKLRQITLGYSDSAQNVWIASAHYDYNDSKWIATFNIDRRIYSTLRVNVTVGEEGNLQTGYKTISETKGFELFTKEVVENTATEAARLAIQALNAKPAPSGTFPVVLSSSAGGTMIHEACGHGLEADLVLAKVSAFADKIGQKVASEFVTIIDDGTIPHKRGSSAIDDEGNPSQRIVLIEHGILKNYLHSRKTAHKMHVPTTGNGRRESYQHIAIPRMRNTFLAPGNCDPESIIKGVKNGLLVKHMGGGQVDTVTGNFVFQATEAYWIQDGNISYPVKNATLAGCGPDILMNITQIGNDLDYFEVGTCGKDGQGVPVSDALPTILCPSLVIGGTA